MDGKTVTAYLRTSQSTDLRFFPSGSVPHSDPGKQLKGAVGQRQADNGLVAYDQRRRGRIIFAL